MKGTGLREIHPPNRMDEIRFNLRVKSLKVSVVRESIFGDDGSPPFKSGGLKKSVAVDDTAALWS